MRELRIYKNETVYCIIVRTNNHELFFQDNSDYEFFIEVLKSRKEKYGFKLYAYCLLNNHYYLLIEPLQGANISKIMQALNTSYTLYFNKKYNRTGHLVGGRFESRLLNKDDGLLNETMHIHLNSSDNYRDYCWSSYGEYMGLSNTGLIDKKYILSFLRLKVMDSCLPAGRPASAGMTADEQAIKNKYSKLIAEEANKKEYARQGTVHCAPTPQDDNSRKFLFRPRFALSLVLLLVLAQFLLPRKINQSYNDNNSDFSSNNNYASLVLPKI